MMFIISNSIIYWHKMNKHFRISKESFFVLFYWSPREDSCPGIHNLHTEESALEKECLVQGYVCFLLHWELPIIMRKYIPENYKLMFLLRAKLQAPEVWEWNLGRFLVLSLVWNISFNLFANETDVQCGQK